MTIFNAVGTLIDGPARDKLIVDSWSRCASDAVDPHRLASEAAVSATTLQVLREESGDLRHGSLGAMRRARKSLSSNGAALLLVGADGVVLETVGDPHICEQATEINLAPGFAWTEAACGTNAIGTALTLKHAVEVTGDEHYCQGFKQWACAAVPISAPLSRKIIGVVDISRPSATRNPYELALAAVVAASVERRLSEAEFERRLHLQRIAMTSYRIDDEAIILCDRHGRVVHASHRARSALNASGRTVRIDHPVSLPLGIKGQAVHHQGDFVGTLYRVDGLKTVAVRSPAAADDPFERIIGSSPAALSAKEAARKLASANVPVLLAGPTGSGKEIFAKALHDAGPHKQGPFIPINCGAVVGTLLASDLFGYGDSAFTGARRGGMAGKFEAADGGTLFLDEIAEMPLDLQAHLLRVLEEGEVQRLGEHVRRPVKVRLLAATNKNLRAEASAGRFRLDLYFRLSVTCLFLPPLKERCSDIRELADHFLQRSADRSGAMRKWLSEPAMQALECYSWPGNIRELRNVIDHAVIFSDGEVIERRNLPELLLKSAGRTVEQSVISLQQVERDTIEQTLLGSAWNIADAADKLGIARSTLYQKIAKFQLGRPGKRISKRSHSN